MRAVREHLGQRHRWTHSIGVARTATRLARRHGVDPERARLAGLLHDYARLWPAAELLAACRERELPIDEFEQRNPIVLHARLAPVLLAERFGIDDAAVGSAIAKHTVAGGEMNMLDTVVYLADALEPGRVFPEREGILALAERDLHAAFRAVLVNTITYLEHRGLEVAPATRAALARTTEVSTA